MSNNIRINVLPDDALVHIFSFVPAHDLAKQIPLVSKRWNLLHIVNALWKPHLKSVWLLQEEDIQLPATPSTPLSAKQKELLTIFSNTYKGEETIEQISKHPRIEKEHVSESLEPEHIYYGWCKNLYKKFQQDWSGYTKTYRHVKGLWNELEKWLIDHKTTIAMEDGLDEEAIQDIEKYLQAALPIEFKCLLRLHNGQAPHNRLTKEKCFFGLFGGYAVYDYHASAYLLNAQSMLEYYGVLTKSVRTSKWHQNALPIIGSSRMLLSLVLKDFSVGGQEFKAGSIVQRSAVDEPFLISDNFWKWVQTYLADLKQGKYDVAKTGEIIRYPALSSFGSDVTTNGVRIRANALFIPESSRLASQDNFNFAYRIRISMDSREPAKLSCKLTMRHWEIIDGNGEKDEVNGAGVIGFYPVMKPGAYFEYCSQTFLPTRTGVMKGSLRFRNLDSGEEFDAVVGPFPLDVNIHI